ncbi:MAG: hypothetical protein ACTSWN_01930 [Promethearchaeota archaeon]
MANPLKTFFKEIKPLLLSHHPRCEKFKDHVFTINGHGFCIGCFVGYPAMFISIMLAFLFDFFNIPHYLLFYTGCAMLSPTIIHVFGIIRKKRHRMISRSAVGGGVGLVIGSILLSDGTFASKIFILFVLSIIYGAVIGAYRTFQVGSTCKKCEFRDSWPKCPGMLGEDK